MFGLWSPNSNKISSRTGEFRGKWAVNPSITGARQSVAAEGVDRGRSKASTLLVRRLQSIVKAWSKHGRVTIQ